MHLKIFIGVLIAGLVSASPKAAPIPKPIAKRSPQFYQGYPGGQLNYFPGASSYFGQAFNPQQSLGQEQDAAGYSYNPPTGYRSSIGAQGYPQTSVGNYRAGSYYQSPQLPPPNYYQSVQASAGNYYQPSPASASQYYQPSQAFASQYHQPSQASTSQYYQPPQAPASQYYQPSQTPAGNHYQPQLIPVPVGYPSESTAQSVQTEQYLSGSSVQNFQPPSYYGAARLWPKLLISPLGSPSPVPDNLVRAYYAVSTPSPLSYDSPNNQIPSSTQSPLSSTPQSLIPVPVKVDTRNYFKSNIKSYNNVPQSIPESKPAPYLANIYQQSTPAEYDQKYLQSASYSLSSSSPQPLTTSRYPINYQSSPAPFQINLLQSTPYQTQANYQSTPDPTVQASYQSTSASPIQPTYQQHSTLSPDPNQFQQQTPTAYLGYQFPGVLSCAPFAGNKQQAPSTYNVGQFQQQSIPPLGLYYQSTASPKQQRISLPVAYSQSQIRFNPTPPTPIFPTQRTLNDATPLYPIAPSTPKPNIILHTTPTPVKEVSITESTFIPIPTSSPSKTKAKIIKSEYSTGFIGPQYNHIPSVLTSNKYTTLTPFLAESGGKSSYSFSHAPEKSYVTYSPSTAVSRVNFKSLANSYSY